MKPGLKYLETGQLSLLAVGAFLLALFLRQGLEQLVGESFTLGGRVTVIQYLLVVYALLLAVLAGVSFTLIRFKQIKLWMALVDLLRATPGETGKFARWLSVNANIKPVILWIGTITGLGLAIRSYFMALPMRYDEASTFLSYVNRPLSSLFRYDVPNNHVLNTLLVKLSVVIFGTDPVAIRLPACLAGVCVIPATFCLVRLLSKGRGGFLAAVLVAGFPYLIYYDTMARGYSLVVLLSLLLGIAGLYFVSRPTYALVFLLSLLAALGLLAMPSFLFPLSGLYLWFAILLFLHTKSIKEVFWSFILPCGLMTGVLTFICYTPVIIHANGIHTIFNNRYVAGLPWPEFLSRLPHHLLDSMVAMRQDIAWPLLVVTGVLMVWGLVGTRSRQSRLLYAALLVGATVTLFLKHAIPYDRTWIYWIPFVCVLADQGFVALCAIRSEHLVFQARTGTGIVLCLWGIHLTCGNSIASYPASFPEAPVIVEVFAKEMRPGDRLVSLCPADNVLSYYLFKKGISEAKAPLSQDSPREFFAVEKSWYSIKDLTQKTVRKVLDLDGASLYVSEN